MKKILKIIVTVISLSLICAFSFGQTSLVGINTYTRYLNQYKNSDTLHINKMFTNKLIKTYGRFMISDYLMPLHKGSSGKVLTMSAAGDSVYWADPTSFGYWSLTGNRLFPTVSTNYIDIDSSIYMHGVDFIRSNPTKLRIAIGTNALRSDTSSGNLGIGYVALAQNISGYENTAISDYTLSLNTSGYRNVAIGSSSMFYNKSGRYNTAIGAYSLQDNETGWNNIAIGYNSAYSQKMSDRLWIGQGDSNNTIIYGYHGSGKKRLRLNSSVYIKNILYVDTIHGMSPILMDDDVTVSKNLTVQDTLFYNILSPAIITVDTSYGHILAIRPSNLDTLFNSIDLISNTTLFPKGTYFHIYKGAYTATVNLARDSCVLYFDAGAIVTKATTGAIFDYSSTVTYKNDIKILGFGDFYKTSTIGEVFTIYHNRSGKVYLFEFNIASATNSNTINITTYSLTKSEIWRGDIRGYNSGLSSGGDVVASVYDTDLTGNSDIIQNISINNVISTAGMAIEASSSIFNVDADYVYSTTNYAIYNYAQRTGTMSTYKCDYVYGAPYGFYNSGTAQSNLIGSVNSVHIQDGVFLCNSVRAITQTGGYSDISMNTNLNYSSGLTPFNISGGTCKIRGNLFYQQYGYGGESSISGTAKVVIFADVLLNQDYSDSDAWLTISGGSCQFQGKLYFLNNGDIHNRKAFIKTGGVLVFNGASMVKSSSYQQFINCPTSAQNIMVYSGGVTTNGVAGDLLSAKARKDSLIVTAVATTTIVLNDGSGGDETFTETDIATYNTTALMAQRMAALINASVTLNITATYVSGATFNIQADVAGTNYIQSGLINLTNTILRLNSYAITEIVGGAIIENSNVTF